MKSGLAVMWNSLYRLGMKIDKKLTPSVRLPCPVLSVGNIALGGRGKTPVVIYLTRKIESLGWKPVVLTRGYGRKKSIDFQLKQEKKTEALSVLQAQDVGDEALEIFLKSPADLLVSKNRAALATKYLQTQPKEKTVFILDDGFQHWALQRDLDVVLIRTEDLGDQIFPFGYLRELPSGLSRADLVLVEGVDFKKVTQVRVPLARSDYPKSILLTTRAPNVEYQRYFLNMGLRHVVTLKDHADSSAIWDALKDFPQKTLLVGAKEAVKLLSPGPCLEFFRSGHGRIESPSGHSYDMVYVELKLDLTQEDLLDRKIESVLKEYPKAP